MVRTSDKPDNLLTPYGKAQESLEKLMKEFDGLYLSKDTDKMRELINSMAESMGLDCRLSTELGCKISLVNLEKPSFYKKVSFSVKAFQWNPAPLSPNISFTVAYREGIKSLDLNTFNNLKLKTCVGCGFSFDLHGVLNQDTESTKYICPNDYVIVYENGYKEIVKKEVFERNYEQVLNKENIYEI